MKNLPKHYILAGSLLAAAVLIPFSVNALGLGMQETPFGGPETMFVDSDVCSCSDTNVHFVMDYASHKEIKLYKDETSKIYDKNNLDEIGKYQLGTYKKSIGGQGDCYQQDGDSCTLLFSVDGIYGNQPGTGTSMAPTEEPFV